MSTVLNNNDLRSEAKAYQRDKNHNTKWARGSTTACGQKCTHTVGWCEDPCSECAVRPMPRDQDRRSGRHAARARQFAEQKLSRQATTLARKAFRGEVTDAMDGPLACVSDNSSDGEDVHDASTAPIPETEIMYSYDATHGPGRGNDVLSHAVTLAVRRFENTETEKLVNKEYDVLDDVNKEGYTADEDDDDYELVDYTHLN